MKNLFDIVVAVAFQSVFRLEIHQNIFFISIQQNNLKKKLKIKKYINNFYFLKKILETQNQSISKAFVNGFYGHMDSTSYKIMGGTRGDTTPSKLREKYSLK
jgi:hypothetical protein